MMLPALISLGPRQAVLFFFGGDCPVNENFTRNDIHATSVGLGHTRFPMERSNTNNIIFVITVLSN